MNMLALTMIAGTLLPAAPVAQADEVLVVWNNKAYAPGELPAELGEGPAGAIEMWREWVLAHGYQMHLDKLGRILLISPEGNGRIKAQLKLVAQTSKAFDEIFPAPERVDEDTPKESGPKTSPSGEVTDVEGIPEDPEGGPVGWFDGSPPLEGEDTYTYEWGAGTWPLDTETCVMLVIRNEADYGSALAQLAELEDYLKPWIAKAREYTGFTLERPLIGAYIEDAAGMEEWNPDSEVVNRLVQMLLIRRFSQLPYWLVQGPAWHIEEKLCKGIYCFPYRSEFIWETEHSSWPKSLSNMFDDREGHPVSVKEFAGWQRGEFVDRCAKISFGMARFLARYHSDELSAFAEDLRVFRKKHDRVSLDDGTWERLPGYTIPVKNVERIMVKHFGESVLEDATRYFRDPKRFKLKKK